MSKVMQEEEWALIGQDRAQSGARPEQRNHRVKLAPKGRKDFSKGNEQYPFVAKGAIFGHRRQWNQVEKGERAAGENNETIGYCVHNWWSIGAWDWPVAALGYRTSGEGIA